MAKLTDHGQDHMHGLVQEFEHYAGAVYAQYADHAHQAGFVSKEQFVSSHSHAIQSGWDGYHAQKAMHPSYGKVTIGNGPAPVALTEEDLQLAAPFLKLVLERMLDLLETEDNWIKNHQEHDGKLCILGAIAKAKKELQLEQQQKDAELDAARSKICATISGFFNKAMYDDHGRGIADFNDDKSTTFEDVKLWLKDQYSRIP